MSTALAKDILEYHFLSKHRPEKYADSLPFLDWDNQPSPFQEYLGTRAITCIIIHATATAGEKSPLDWLTREDKVKVSAHYVIAKDGKVYGLVDENDIAWHCGLSEWRGKQFVNTFSIGIELVNLNDGVDEYTEKEIASCAKLCAEICAERNISVSDVVGHADVSPGRKTDPEAFPWIRFRKMVTEKMLNKGGG